LILVPLNTTAQNIKIQANQAHISAPGQPLLRVSGQNTPLSGARLFVQTLKEDTLSGQLKQIKRLNQGQAKLSKNCLMDDKLQKKRPCHLA